MVKKAKRPATAPKGKDGKDPLGEIQRLYRFMTEQGLDRLEFGRDDYHVRLVRRRAAPPPAAVVVSSTPAGISAPTKSAPVSGRADVPPGGWVVKSPMMGIFYRGASPSSPPFAKEGDVVKAGQVLCLVEAMKVFNEVRAESDGRVHAIMVENGKPVQAGQELVVLTK